MVKLLRFKYEDTTKPGQAQILGQDVRGFGKQPIALEAYSSIALKNYNIKLIAQLNDMVFTVGYTDIITFMVAIDGESLKDIKLPSGSYTADEIRRQLQLYINAVNGLINNDTIAIAGFQTEVILQQPQSEILIRTYMYPAIAFPIIITKNFTIRLNEPGLVDRSEGNYDCTAAYTYSKSRINNGVPNTLLGGIPSTIMLGGDCVRFTINNLGGNEGSFYYSASKDGDVKDSVSLWGIAFSNGIYKYASNSANKKQWNNMPRQGGVNVTPTVGDIVTVIRSGTLIQFTIKRGLNIIITVEVIISIEALKAVDATYNYVINTTGPIIVSDMIFPMSGYTNQDIPIRTMIHCESLSLAEQLGFPSTEPIYSIRGTPAVIALGKVAGGVKYEGIIICINGLDLETYDFATTAEGKTNFLYTIQKNLDQSRGLITSASGNLTNEPYIDMNNQGAININNKLSIYFLDTASGKKLEFTYADLLIIVK